MPSVKFSDYIIKKINIFSFYHSKKYLMPFILVLIINWYIVFHLNRYGFFLFSQVWITILKVSKWALLNHFLLSIGVNHLLTSSLYTILISLDKCSNFYCFAWQKCSSNFHLHALFSFILSCFMLQYKFLIFKLKVRASFLQDHVPIFFLRKQN